MTTFPAEARPVPAFRPLRALLVVAAALLFTVGWTAGALWAVTTWTWAAIGVGFVSGRGIGASDG